MSIQDDVITILEKTQDGELLTPTDLKLTENAVNGFLSEAGEVALAKILASVTDGTYFALGRWFHGIEHLTCDHQGYVAWRNRRVEHFSFSDKDREQEAAKRLGARCLHLEAIDIPVTRRTAINPDCYNATADTPWKALLPLYYAFFRRDGRVLAVFNTPRAVAGAIALEREAAGLKITRHEDACSAFQALQSSGATAVEAPRDFPETVLLLEALGIAPEIIEQEVNRLPAG